MTVKEFYEITGGDYDRVTELLLKDKLIKKFVLKFANDGSYNSLKEAIANGDIEASFHAAHTLKGVSANLGFVRLQSAVSDLTEQLRPCTEQADPALVQKVDECYASVMDNMKELD